MTLEWAAAAATSNDAYLIWGFVALAAAIGLIGLELIVPSGGLIAVLASVAIILSVVSFFRFSTTAGAISIGCYLVLGPIAGIYGFRWWMHSPLGRRMVLGGEEPIHDTADEAAAASERERQERTNRLRALIGLDGVAATALRPVGTVVIEGQRVDALAEEGIIEPETPVIVVDAYDNQIKVRARS